MANPFTKIKEFVKAHPYGTAAAVFVVGILWILLRRKSPQQGQSTMGYDYAAVLNANAASVQAGNELQAITLQSNAKIREIQAQQDIATQQIAGEVEVAKLQSQVALNNNTLQADVAKQLALLQSQTTLGVSTLQAQVAQAQTQAEVTKAQIAATQFTTVNAQNTAATTAIVQSNNATTQNIVATTTQQIGVNGIIHTLPQNSIETALRGEGYQGAFGAGGADAFLIQKYGTAGARNWYITHGVSNPGV